MKLITSSTAVSVLTYERGTFLCQISLGVRSGARLEHTCIKHHLNILFILFYHIYVHFHFTQQYLIQYYIAPSLLRRVPDNVFMTQVIVYVVSSNGGPMGGLLGTLLAPVTSEVQKTGPWAHFWGFREHAVADFRVGGFTGIASMHVCMCIGMHVYMYAYAYPYVHTF